MQKQTFIQETWSKLIFSAIELSFPLVISFSTRDSEYVAITEYRLTSLLEHEYHCGVSLGTVLGKNFVLI